MLFICQNRIRLFDFIAQRKFDLSDGLALAQ